MYYSTLQQLLFKFLVTCPIQFFNFFLNAYARVWYLAQEKLWGLRIECMNECL